MKNMKRRVELRNYYFERIEIKLPPFPAKGGEVIIQRAAGKYTTYLNRKRKNWIAFKWLLDISPKNKQKKKMYSTIVTIVGIFEVTDASVSSPQKRVALVRRVAPDMLLEVIKQNLDRIYFHSAVKNGTFPAIETKAIKSKKVSARRILS